MARLVSSAKEDEPLALWSARSWGQGGRPVVLDGDDRPAVPGGVLERVLGWCGLSDSLSASAGHAGQRDRVAPLVRFG
jgi:hypothetical protein